MVDVLYALVSMIAMLVVTVLLRFNRDAHDEEARSFRILMWFIEAFCFVDTVWGFIASLYISSTPSHLFVISSVLHVSAILASVIWCHYTFHYLHVNKIKWKIISMAVPGIAGIALVVINIRTHSVFDVDEQMNYTTGNLRSIIAAIEAFYFVMPLIIAIILHIKEKDIFKKKQFYSVETYCVLPILFALLQAMFPEAPFLSCGYMVAAIAVFLGIVSADKTQRAINVSEQYKEQSKEIYGALESIAKSFVSVHLFDLRANRQVPVYSNRFIDEFIDEKDGADVQIKKVINGVVEPEYVDEVLKFGDLNTLSSRLRGQRVVSCEFLGRNQGWCMASFIKVAQDTRGNLIKAIMAVQNINEAKQREHEYELALEEAYEDRNMIYSEMLRMQAGGVIATDECELILAMNEAAAKMFGYPSTEVATCDFKVLLNRMDFDNFEKAKEDYNNFMENGEGKPYYFRVKNYKGTELYVMGLPKRIVLANGKRAIITSYTDISINKEMENKLVELSETDALTGICNRGSGESRTEKLLASGSMGMFCIIDIDQFKRINDSFGHMAGDKALIEVALALKKSFREKDVVMRLGGDEFAVYAEGILTETAAKRCFARFFESLGKIRIPELGNYVITVSLGATFVNEENEVGFDDVYQRADAIMYECKETPGNCFSFTKKY